MKLIGRSNERKNGNGTKPLSTVFEAPDAEEKEQKEAEMVAAQAEAESKKQPPERPPPPKLFPDPIEDKLVDLPDAPTDAPEVAISERNPQAYQLVQMSQDMPSFDLGSEVNLDLEDKRLAFGRQNSNSFWWDVDGEDTPSMEIDLDQPFMSTISTTVYGGTFCFDIVLGVFLSDGGGFSALILLL